MSVVPEQILEKMRQGVEPEALLRFIDYRPEMIQQVGQTIKAFCPIHREPIFRTLLVDLPSRTYRCSNRSCPGHAGGDMIDLYTRSSERGIEAALASLAHHFAIAVDLDSVKSEIADVLQIAQTYLDSNAFADAEVQIENVLAFDPANVAALKILVDLYGASGEENKLPDVQLRLARGLSADDQTREVADLYDVYLRSRPADGEARRDFIACLEKLGDEERLAGEYINLADELSAAGQIDEAIEVYGRIDRMAAETIDVSMHVFQLLMASGRTAEAIAQKIDESEALKQSGDYYGAFECLRVALRVDAERDDLRVKMAELVGGQRLRKEAFSTCVQEVKGMIARKNLKDAIEAARHLGQNFSRSTSVLELSADLEEAQGRYDEATEMRLVAVDIYESRESYEDALRMIHVAAEKRRDDVSLISREAQLLRKLGRIQEAVWCYLLIGSLFESAGEMESSASIYETIIELRPEELPFREHQFELYLGLGIEPAVEQKALALADFYEAAEDREKASEALHKALDAASQNKALLERHGILLQAMGWPGEAVKRFYPLAQMLAETGEYDRAQEILERALACVPDDAEIMELKADVLARQDRTLPALSEYGQLLDQYLETEALGAAVRAAKKILNLQPDHQATLGKLAVAYEKLGDARELRAVQLQRVALYRRAESFARAEEICREMLAAPSTAPSTADDGDVSIWELMIEIAAQTGREATTLEALWEIAKLHAASGQGESEQVAIEKLLERDPVHREAAKRSLELSLGGGSKAIATASTRVIDRFLEKSRQREVTQIYEELAEKSEAKPEILDGLVRLYRLAEDSQGVERTIEREVESLVRESREAEASGLLGELVQMRPDDLSLRQRRIELMLGSGATEDAANQFRVLAALHTERGQLEEAERCVERVLELTPGDLKAQSDRITIFIDRKKFDEATAAIEDLAGEYLKRSDDEKAVATYERAFAFDPNCESILRKIVAVKRNAGDVSGALVYYRRLLRLFGDASRNGAFERTTREALEIAPDEASLRYQLAEHLAKQGRVGEAEAALLEWVQGLVEAENLSQADSALEKVFELNKHSARGRAFRAELLAKRGDAEAALKEFLSLRDKIGVTGGNEGGAAMAATSADLPEAIAPKSEYTFGSFDEGQSNKLARAAARAVYRAPGKMYNPLFVYGGLGLGKTHLCHALAREIAARHPDLKILNTTADAFVARVEASIEARTLAAFRGAHRALDVLILDDVHRVAGNPRAEEELRRLVSSMCEAGRQVFVTSLVAPGDLDAMQPELRSRMTSGILVGLQPPDEATRLAILRADLESRGRSADVSDEVLAEIAKGAEANPRALKSALNQLLALADLEERPVDSDLAKQALAPG